MQELDTAYQILDLEPGASMEEVNQAYKDLVFIWHPDRLPKDNLRLIEKAQEKIKQLNQARDYLRTHARVGTPTSSNGSNAAGTGYRSRTRPYGRAAGNPSYRQHSTSSRPSESSQQTYQNPYRNYQARYAQARYGNYGTYRQNENQDAQARNGTTGDRPPSSSSASANTSASGSTPGNPSHRYTNGNSASHTNANDGWNNYTTPRPSGSGNSASNSRDSGPSYTVNSDRSTTSSYRPPRFELPPAIACRISLKL